VRAAPNPKNALGLASTDFDVGWVEVRNPKNALGFASRNPTYKEMAKILSEKPGFCLSLTRVIQSKPRNRVSMWQFLRNYKVLSMLLLGNRYTVRDFSVMRREKLWIGDSDGSRSYTNGDREVLT
jgi:hypothetical protein